MNTVKPIVIIGAGIGGLALGVALRRKGFEVQIFEQAPALGEVGAGLGLWANAIRFLRELGIEDAFWDRHACDIRAVEIANASGRVLSSYHLGKLTEELDAKSYVVHRADLHRALRSLLPDDAVTCGARYISLTEMRDCVYVDFDNGTDVDARLVVGADGPHSVVRSQLFGQTPPRYSGQTCYRGIADFKASDLHTLREVQGRAGLRAAVFPLGNERVYWWATRPAPEGERDTPEERKPLLERLFEGWESGFPQALAATPPEAILRNDLHDRPPLKTWTKGSVTLLGDAAHPMTPNLGQGACLAIEDATVLARCLSEQPENPTNAFAAYESARMRRCYRIVKQSRRMGAVGGWSNPAAVKLREFLLRMTPASVLERMFRQQLDSGMR